MVIGFSLGLGPIPWLIMSEVWNTFSIQNKYNHKEEEFSNCYIIYDLVNSDRFCLFFFWFWRHRATFGYWICGVIYGLFNYASQILPVNIKGLAGSIATMGNWLIAWVVTMTANLLLNWSSGGECVYSACLVCFYQYQYNADLNVYRDIYNLRSSSCHNNCFYSEICPWDQGKNIGRNSVFLQIDMFWESTQVVFLV